MIFICTWTSKMAKTMDPILRIVSIFEILGHYFGLFWRSRYIHTLHYITPMALWFYYVKSCRSYVIKSLQSPEAHSPFHALARMDTELTPGAFCTHLLLVLTLWLKTAQEPYITWSLSPKTVKYASLEP